MYITLNRILKDLEQKFEVDTYHIENIERVTEIELLPSEKVLKPGELDPQKIYLCDLRLFTEQKDFLQNIPVICAISSDMEIESGIFANSVGIVVYHCSLEELMLFLSKRFYQYGRKSSEILEISERLIHCKSLEELFDVGFSILKNPIVVTDSSQQVMKFTSPTLVADPVYGEIVDLTYLPVGNPTDDSFLEYWKSKETPFMHLKGAKFPQAICKELVAGDFCRGYLHVIEFQKKISEQDIYAANILGNLMTAYLTGPNRPAFQNKESEIGQFLRDLMGNRVGNAERAKEKSKELGMKLKDYLVSMIILQKEDPVKVGFAFPRLEEKLTELIPGSYGYLYRNSVNLLISFKDMGLYRRKMNELEQFLCKNQLTAGVSNPFTELMYLRENSMQAMKAVELGMTLNPKGTMNYYSDYAAYHMLEAGAGQGSSAVFCMPEMKILLDYCAVNGPELLHTLKTYIDCRCNKAQTAKLLYTHPNTIKYRVGQIEELMGIDLENTENIVDIVLTFKMMRLYKAFPPKGEDHCVYNSLAKNENLKEFFVNSL